MNEKPVYSENRRQSCYNAFLLCMLNKYLQRNKSLSSSKSHLNQKGGLEMALSI